EQLDHRDAQGLGFDINEGALHPGHGLGRNAARTLASAACHIPEARLKGSGVLADKQRCEVGDGPDDTVWRAAVAALAPTSNTLVCVDFHKRPGPPASVDNKGFDVSDFHSLPHITGSSRPQVVALPVAGCGAPASGVSGLPVAGSTSKGLNSSSSFPISRTAGKTSSPLSPTPRIWSSRALAPSPAPKKELPGRIA